VRFQVIFKMHGTTQIFFKEKDGEKLFRKSSGNCLTMKVWRKIPRSEMPRKRSCVKSRWVFDIKQNGIFRDSLVASGYSQVPGKDFTEIFSPVKTDFTLRNVLIAVILWSLDCMLIDIITAFLYVELDEKICMECPPGLVHNED
jgi:Reverse transcriptase (RNA-dependent DNA polymerase)